MDYIQTRELYHHGIKGQKWGVRRFQDESGELTAEGKARYGVDNDGNMSKEGRRQYKQDVRQQRKDIKKEWKEITKKNIKERGGIFADEESVRWAREDTRKILTEKYGEDAITDAKVHEGKKNVAISLSLFGAAVAADVIWFVTHVK